jgi:hypothetical protein
MMLLTELLIRIPALSLLAYIPLVCYLDLKRRMVPLFLWLPLWVVNMPVAFYLYREGLYPVATIPLSLIIGAFLYAAMRVGAYQNLNGDDLLYLWAISAFFIINPFPVPHGIAFVGFYIYLVAAMLLTVPVVMFLNIRAGRKGLQYPGGIPMMLPISAALMMTVVMG